MFMLLGECFALFPCAGAANLGQISNKIAVVLEEQGIGNLMCTVGIGARAPELMKSAESSDRIIAIDGCPVYCASKTLELEGFRVDRQILIFELRVKKTRDRIPKDEGVVEVLENVIEIFQME